MSMLSNFGFAAETDQEFNDLLDLVFESGKSIKTAHGNYLCYYDPSGSEVWIQGTKDYDIIGIASKFEGKSRRKVCLNGLMEQEENPMNAHFNAWAEPEDDNPESGIYPFLFNMPDFRLRPISDLPQNCEIQLTADPQEISYFEDDKDFRAQQSKDTEWALPSFVPVGLFEDEDSEEGLQPVAMFTGTVTESKILTNELTGQSYYWMLAETLGGPVDVVAQPSFFDSLPQPEGIIHGTFWLSGKIL